jgi:hypothetical protein
VTAPATVDRVEQVDLRRAPLADLRALDLRSASRDYWADEAALHDRLTAGWAGLDDAAWRLPGAAPSDAGGPDWSLLDHVGHIVDWWELATDYIAVARDRGIWPSSEDFDGGDFDTFNETRRERFAAIPPADLRDRAETSRAAVLAVARQLPAETIRSDAAWGWVHQVLHGHAIDHLNVLEPWTYRLHLRQVGNDPFGPDPQPTRRTLAETVARFWIEEASVLAAFGRTLASVPDADWTRPVGPAWSFADHVAHIAGWFDVAADALERHRATGTWREMPPEGVDAFNDRQVRAARGTPPAGLRDQFDAGRERLHAAVTAMSDEEWLDPEGFGWAYECLHGHVRAHHAMVGPWTARLRWPDPGSGS